MRNTLIGLALLLLGTSRLAAQNQYFWVDRFDKLSPQDRAPEGWDLQQTAGRAKIRMEQDGERIFPTFNATNASFGIKKEFELDLKTYPYLNWKWKVDKLPERGNFLKSETDDQAAQIYVAFPRFPAKVNTNFVCYYWESEPKNLGVTGSSVAWSKAKIIVVQAGKENLNRWIWEKRNVYDDYKRLFDREPPKVGGLAFYINSQHTRSEAESSLDEIYFSKE